MKALKSNSRIAFAYQEKESVAAQLNPALSSTGSGYIVRVVQPAKSIVETIPRHKDYSSDSSSPLEHATIDRLLSAYIVRIRKEKNFEAAQSVSSNYSATSNIVQKVSTVQAPSGAGEPVIIDLKLHTTIQGTDWETDLRAGNPYIVAIRLMFESGVEETLELYLKAYNHLFLSIDPRDLTIGDAFNAGVSTTQSQVTAGGLFSAYNIAKCYRKIEDRGEGIPAYYGISWRNNDQYALWTSYTQPWGFIRTATTPGLEGATDEPTDLDAWSLSSPTWATNANAFVTNHKSSLSWFSGNSDMSATYIDSTQWPGTSDTDDQENQSIDLRKFFEFKAPWKHATASGDHTLDLIWPDGLPKWGQRFGWYSNFTGNWVHKVSGIANNDTYQPGQTNLYGLPLKATVAGQNSFDASLGTVNYDFKQGDAGAPPMFNGNFNTTTPYSDGDYGFPNNVNFGSGSSYNIGGIAGPQAVRIRKYLINQGVTDVTLNAPLRTELSNHTGGTLLKLYQQLGTNNIDVGNSNNMPTKWNLENVKTSYYFTPALGNVNSYQVFNSGSVDSIVANNAVNFFYAGGVTDGNEHLEPIFKGYIRNFVVARYGQSDSINTLAALPRAVALEAIDAGAEFAQNMDLRGVVAGAYGSTTSDTARFNAIDLTANLLWNSHSIKPTFEHGDLITYDDTNLIDKTRDYLIRTYGLFALATKWDGGTITTLGSAFELAAQDIAFINSAVNTIPNTTGSVEAGNALHPIGSALSRIPNVYNTPPTPAADANALAIGGSSIQVSPMVRGASTYYNEISGSALGVFPIGIPTTPATTVFSTYRNPRFKGSSGVEYSSLLTGGGTDNTWTTNNPLPRFPSVSFDSDYVATTGTSTVECLRIKGSSVTYEPVSSSTSLGQGEQYHKVTYQMIFENTCSGAFQNAGSYTVNTGTLATKVAGVLNIFPHIEFNALAAYKPSAFAPDVNGLQLAYRIVVTDENDVDDIKIESVSGNTYKLTIVFTQGDNDVYNSPDDDIDEDIDIPGTQFWPDTPISLAGTGNPYDPSDYAAYSGYEGSEDYNKQKGSYITVSTLSDWRERPHTGFGEGQNQAIVLGDNNIVYHHAFLTFGTIRDVSVQNVIDEETVEIPGCTDPTAINYNPDATTDDGSCIDCQDQANGKWDLANDGLVTSTGGVRPGVYGTGYLFGQAGGTQTQASVGFNLTAGNEGYGTYFSPGANYGGAVIADNNYLGSAASVNLSIKAATITSSNDFTAMLADAAAYNNDASSWKLRIIPVSDSLLDIVDLTNSYSENNPAPAALTGAAAIYTATATGGDIYAPTWANISTPASPLSGLNAGVPYLLELKFQPTNLPASCTTYASGDAIVYGLFWVGFCSCAVTTNEYFNIAMNGQGYPWNSANPFPVVDYSTGVCPDVVNPANYFGDNDYPASICFRADDQSSTCENFFLWCVATTSSSCNEDISSLDEAYQEGDLYYYDYFNFTTTLLFEGVYNSASNSYVFDPNTVFTVTITGPDGYSVTQNNSDATLVTIDGGAASALQLTFDAMTAPGDYTLTWTFPDANGVYDTFYGEFPCSYTETITVQAPSTICSEIIPGCTDPTADNYDINANFDNDSCEYVDPCTEVFNNTNLPTTAVATSSSSICVTDTFIIGGIEYQANVIVPDNNGTVTVTTVYDAPTEIENNQGSGAVSQFAILLFPQSVSIPAFSSGVVDSTSTLFGQEGLYPTSFDVGTTLEINGEVFGFYSPLFDITGSTDELFTHTFTSLPPNTYSFLAIPDLGNAILNDCSEVPAIRLEDYIGTVSVGLTDPTAPCEENCIGADCEDLKPGCTDPNATNYDATASYDDGSCIYVETFCEANPGHELCVDCDTEAAIGSAPVIVSGRLDETICDPVNGSDGECTDPNACNYNPDAPLELSNNQLCDYCSCAGPNDADCDGDDDCDPENDENCGPPEPECPDPGNPNCDPTIYDPCPDDDCGPPVPPCIALGNCPPGDPGDPGDPVDPFNWDEPTVTLTCIPDVAGVDSEQAYFDNVIQSAFQCMSEEGKKMLFRMKAGAKYSEEDLVKLSLIAYLLNGGADFTDIPCIFNCNYESKEKNKVVDAKQQWQRKGARFWASTDTYVRGDVVIYYYQVNGKIKRSIYEAQRTITPQDLHPRYMGSGWHRLTTVKVRTKDTNGIATGEENYLQTFWEFLTRFCTSCTVTNARGRNNQAVNQVDPKILRNYLDVPTDNKSKTNLSGILGEDGDEIIF